MLRSPDNPWPSETVGHTQYEISFQHAALACIGVILATIAFVFDGSENKSASMWFLVGSQTLNAVTCHFRRDLV